MRFRSPTSDTIYVASTNGHSAYVGSEFKEIHPSLVREALSRGCLTDAMDAQTQESIIRQANHNEPTRKELIVSAMRKLISEGKPGSITSNGHPNLFSLSALVPGPRVNKEEMMQAFNAISSESMESDDAQGPDRAVA